MNIVKVYGEISTTTWFEQNFFLKTLHEETTW